MKITRGAHYTNTQPVDLLERGNDPVVVEPVRAGVKITIPKVPFHNFSVDTVHDFYIELSHDDLRLVFDALVDAAASEDDDL